MDKLTKSILLSFLYLLIYIIAIVLSFVLVFKIGHVITIFGLLFILGIIIFVLINNEARNIDNYFKNTLDE